MLGKFFRCPRDTAGLTTFIPGQVHFESHHDFCKTGLFGGDQQIALHSCSLTILTKFGQHHSCGFTKFNGLLLFKKSCNELLCQSGVSHLVIWSR